MNYLSAQEARAFVQKWLPAWSGNNPALLAGFYSDDAFYLDPAIPAGAKGKAALLAYFTKLLAFNPMWEWTQIEGIPMQDGFLNKWRAKIPVRETVLEIVGVCFAQLDQAGKIYRNEAASTARNCCARSAKAAGIHKKKQRRLQNIRHMDCSRGRSFEARPPRWLTPLVTRADILPKRDLP